MDRLWISLASVALQTFRYSSIGKHFRTRSIEVVWLVYLLDKAKDQSKQGEVVLAFCPLQDTYIKVSRNVGQGDPSRDYNLRWTWLMYGHIFFFTINSGYAIALCRRWHFKAHNLFWRRSWRQIICTSAWRGC